MIVQHSDNLEVSDTLIKDPIYLVEQFFKHSNNERHKEIKKCLRKNVENSFIDKIILLNEREYTSEELGTTSDKIQQVVIKNRLTYKDVFEYVDKLGLNGYIIFANSDIYLDNTVKNLYKTNLSKEKIFMAQLRFNVNKNNKARIFGPRFDSQDTWIFHSNMNPLKRQRKIMNFNFGMPGCDNAICYLMKIIGYKIVNHPNFVRTFHLHNTNIRNYTNKDRVNMPYLCIEPLEYNTLDAKIDYYKKLYKETKSLQKFTLNDNDVLREYLSEKISNNEPFVIPRIAGIENNIAHLALYLNNQEMRQMAIQNIKRIIPVMKNNAGIKITNVNSIIEYSNKYLEAFQNCDLYANWSKFDGTYYNHIKQSHDFIELKFSNKKTICTKTLGIFSFIYNNPWTTALKNKRILIISSFIESIKQKIDIREKIYGVDLFPGCSFVFLKPPQTNVLNESREFTEELAEFTQRIEAIKDEFDVALVSCGGYGNLVCNEMFKMRKSSIYVGGILQMFFGIYGARWMKDSKYILNLYLNEFWSRPMESEKPKGFERVENGCYW